jgi:hypothetical protein
MSISSVPMHLHQCSASGMAPAIVASTDIALGLSVLFPFCTMLFPRTSLCNVLFPYNAFSVVLCSAAFLFSCWLVLECRLRMAACHTRPAKDRGILLQIYCSILSASPPMKSILFFYPLRTFPGAFPVGSCALLPACTAVYRGRIYPQMRVLDYRPNFRFARTIISLVVSCSTNGLYSWNS